MKKIIIILIAGVILNSCKSKPVVNTDITKINKDTIKIDRTDVDSSQFKDDTELFEVSRDLNTAKLTIDYLRDVLDSVKYVNTKLNSINDSLININKVNNEKLGVAQFKLLRIREYNRIAAKGNNVKFLRSWINRTIQ